jgi:hypothetical protein
MQDFPPFQLYRDRQFYWWKKLVDPGKPPTHSLSNTVVHLALIEIRTHNINDNWNQGFLLVRFQSSQMTMDMFACRKQFPILFSLMTDHQVCD